VMWTAKISHDVTLKQEIKKRFNNNEKKIIDHIFFCFLFQIVVF
jgi:hypothetical protein